VKRVGWVEISLGVGCAAGRFSSTVREPSPRTAARFVSSFKGFLEEFPAGFERESEVSSLPAPFLPDALRDIEAA